MDIVEELRKLGYEVKSFNQWHHRVENVFDFWTGKSGCKWWYRTTDERGNRPPDQIKFLVKALLGDPGTLPGAVTEHDFVHRLVSIGWSEKEAREQWKEWSSRAASLEA